MTIHRAVQISDSSHPGEARRLAMRLAIDLGFDESDAGRVALVVTEAASNIVKHAGHGLLLLRGLPPPDVGVEVLALDRAGGMVDVPRALRDGYSTAGSPGTGLGAISRLASVLDIYSVPRLGTALLTRVYPKSHREAVKRSRTVIGSVQVAAPGEEECGDGWSVVQSEQRFVALVADGLGHGPAAARAAAEAVRALEMAGHASVTEILQTVHRLLVPTRGAAVSVAEIDYVKSEVHYAGLGNVTGVLVWPGGMKSMVTQNGIAGGDLQRVRVMSYPWPAGGLLLMYTDGLNSHVSVQSYPGLLTRDPTLVAGVLYRDFHRDRDDATVLVARERQ